MKCPYCSFQEDRVLESRPARDGEAIRRRRECLRCERRFTTYEQVEARPLWVVKKDGRREAFDREKVLRGLRLACRKRPVSMETLDRVADQIEREFSDRGDPEVPASEVGERVVTALRDLDPVAFIRFASVYRDFQNPAEFREVLEIFSTPRRRRNPTAGFSG